MLLLHVTMAEYSDLYDAVAQAERPAVFAEQSPYLDIGQYTQALETLFGTDAAEQLLDALRQCETVRVLVVQDMPQHRITPSP